MKLSLEQRQWLLDNFRLGRKSIREQRVEAILLPEKLKEKLDDENDSAWYDIDLESIGMYAEAWSCLQIPLDEDLSFFFNNIIEEIIQIDSSIEKNLKKEAIELLMNEVKRVYLENFI